MNLSTAMFRIKTSLGIYGLALPIENLDEMITKFIQDITIPVFSTYLPYEETIMLDMNKLKRLEHTALYSTWLLPDFKERKLLYIKDIRYDDRSIAGMGYWGGTIPFLHSGVVNNLMTMNAAANLVGTMLPKMNFRYVPKRKIIIYNCIASHALIFDMRFEHDKSLMSIPETAEESFYELALLDAKTGLYPIMKHFRTINTVYGTIELNIDDWAEAENQRKELLSRWDETYHLDLGQITWS